MKKILVLITVASMVLGMASAQGMMGNGKGNPGLDAPAQNAVVSTLTGTVTMESGQPEIKANGKVYTLVAPLRSIVFLPWKEGAAVTVTGYVQDAKKIANGVTLGDRVIAVTITLNGKTYEIPQLGRGQGGMDCQDDDQDFNRGGKDNQRGRN